MKEKLPEFSHFSLQNIIKKSHVRPIELKSSQNCDKAFLALQHAVSQKCLTVFFQNRKK